MGQPHGGFALADGARSGTVIRGSRFKVQGLADNETLAAPFVIPSRARNLCCSYRFQFRRFLARLPMNSSQLRLKFRLPRWSVSSRRAQSAPGGSRSTRAAARIGSLARPQQAAQRLAEDLGMTIVPPMGLRVSASKWILRYAQNDKRKNHNSIFANSALPLRPLR